MNLETIKSNKLGALLSIAIPSIISMVLTSFITVADGFFTGNYVGKEGMAAINLGLPIVYLFLAVGLMVAIGGMAIAGIELGGGDAKKANAVFRQTTAVTIIISILLAIVIGILLNPIAVILSAEGLVKNYFVTYYSILLLELPIMIINSELGMFIRAEGKAQYFMVTNIVNVVLNILLDYSFLKYFGLGISGIAYGSVIAAVISLVLNIIFFVKLSDTYKFGKFTFDKEVFKQGIANGFSEFIGEISMCLTMFAYNFVLMHRFGADSVTAFTIVGYVSYVFSMIIVGFGQGMSPLVSFTYGAKDYETCFKLRKISSQFCIGAGIVVIVFLAVVSKSYCHAFIKDEAVLEITNQGVLIFMTSFLFTGYNTISSFFFTSIGKAKESAVISSLRGFILILLFIFTLPIAFGLTGIWLVAPVTEAITAVVCIIYLSKQEKLPQPNLS